LTTEASTMPEPRVDTPNGALTLLQDRFVDEYVANGGDGRAAAQAAGYTGRRLDCRAADLLKHPVVIAEISRRTAQLLARCAPLAANTLKQLLGSAKRLESIEGAQIYGCRLAALKVCHFSRLAIQNGGLRKAQGPPEEAGFWTFGTRLPKQARWQAVCERLVPLP
jgi:hypothetical protein